MEQLDDLLAGAEIVLSNDILDRIDQIVPPGTDVGQLHAARMRLSSEGAPKGAFSIRLRPSIREPSRSQK